MSGCMDVCITHDYDDYNTFYAERMSVARKQHKCCECGETIDPGERYESASGKNHGGFFTAKTCGICAEVRAAFVCGTWIFGQLWESVEQEMFPLWRERGPFECLAKLDTVEAREECQRRFAEWQQERAA